MYKDWLYFTTPDAHLSVAEREGRHGALGHRGGRFEKGLLDDDGAADRARITSLSACRAISIICTGFLRSIDPETGKTQWKWDSTPPVGTPDATSGGMTWMTGTYDPELNLIYWGTGNPTPVLNGKTRPGDDLYTCSIVALESRHRQAARGPSSPRRTILTIGMRWKLPSWWMPISMGSRARC